MSSNPPKVVIVGGGFGGLRAAKGLRKAACHVTLIDRRNYHLFQPLLYQVATGELSPANIASPLRVLLRQSNCEVMLGHVDRIEVERRQVHVRDGRAVDYDALIMAAGARTGYFGHDEWQQVAPGLKTLEDATEIRRRIFHAFEAAEWCDDPAERAKWMTFVIVGGGPTGTELAGALSEIARYTLRHDFHHIDPSEARIVLVEAAPRVLTPFSEEASGRALRDLENLGVEVRTGTMVTDVTESAVMLLPTPDGTAEALPTRTVIWAAGVQANGLGKSVAAQTGATVDRGGRILVDPLLNIPGHPEIFVVGDLAHCDDTEGRPLPGLAPVAMQQGTYVAQVLIHRWTNKSSKPFHYVDRGSMAVIGRWRALARIGGRTFHGWFAWFLWLFVHIAQINRLQNRFLVMMQWAGTFVTRSRAARLISEPWGAKTREQPRGDDGGNRSA